MLLLNLMRLLPPEIYLRTLLFQASLVRDAAPQTISPVTRNSPLVREPGSVAHSHTRCREKAMKASFSQDSQAISGRWLMVINGKWPFSLWTFTVAGN